MFLSSRWICAHFKNMKGIGRGGGYFSSRCFWNISKLRIWRQAERGKCRKHFVANRSRRGFYRVVWTSGREFGPERERRGRAAKGMYKGVKAGRGRSEIDTAGEVSLAIPAISSRARFQFMTDIIADSLFLILLFLKEKIL